MLTDRVHLRFFLSRFPIFLFGRPEHSVAKKLRRSFRCYDKLPWHKYAEPNKKSPIRLFQAFQSSFSSLSVVRPQGGPKVLIFLFKNVPCGLRRSKLNTQGLSKISRYMSWSLASVKSCLFKTHFLSKKSASEGRSLNFFSREISFLFQPSFPIKFQLPVQKNLTQNQFFLIIDFLVFCLSKH